MDHKNTNENLYSIKLSGKMAPYISYIRFPFYKNIEPDLKIEFNFPITVLVGQNGTNKSSVLRAVFGCPDGYSVGRFWFSTAVDPILEKDEKGRSPRFIYGYYNSEVKSHVEIIKTRVEKKRTINKKTFRNPDYWEPSRPIVADGMKPMPKENNLSKDELERLGRSKTRWNAIKKSVIFKDFRSEISAFDKYFYHGDLQRTLKYDTKQDFVRERSKHLKKTISGDLKSLKLFKGQKEHIQSNETLSSEKIKEISRILGRKYKTIKLVKHKLFKVTGSTAMISSEDLVYSEAFAGSGEFAIITLVNDILNAPERSLIVLDEPEVSLHPGAQEKLVEFLKTQAKTKKHQIVIGSHSPFIIRNLPDKAIKTLYQNPQTKKISCTNETNPSEAFFHLGINDSKKVHIYTEDKLASELVTKALSTIGQSYYEACSVKNPPGGESTLLCNYAPSIASLGHSDALFFIDGDQNPMLPSDFFDKIEALTDSDLDKKCQKIAGGKVNFHCDSGKSGTNKKQLRDAMIKYLRFAERNISFLPSETPEKFIWENSSCKLIKEIDNKCYKERFVSLTKKKYGKQDYEECTSEEIFNLQKIFLAEIDHSTLKPISEILKGFVDREHANV
ncbi:ATP-binding protein [uncultured Alcanivorax sp.]|uniref:ATP-binding protein n=1 Tax=Alcanivorax borkumensis TaxID=59754 RepID=UPI00258D1DDA|nr:ATP-binding protein [uncultured Alcanivorax sp.]